MYKRILITGGNRGLGLETALQLIKKGHEVIITGRNTDALQQLKREYGDRGLRTVGMDVTDEESIMDAYNKVKKHGDSLDVLINNAGIFVDYRDSTDVERKVMEKTLRTNLLGPLMVSQRFLSLLNESDDPRIINVSSGMGAFSDQMAGSAAYRISKTALNGLTATMASDLQGGVKVVSVCPGWVRTDMGGTSAPRSKEQGVSGIVWLALSDEVISGKFYRDGKIISW